MKKNLCLFAVVCLILLIRGTALGSEAARLGDRSFDTLQEALDAAAEGDTVLLTSDRTENAVIRKDRVTLEMQSHTLLGEGDTLLRVEGKHVSVRNGKFGGQGQALKVTGEGFQGFQLSAYGMNCPSGALVEILGNAEMRECVFEDNAGSVIRMADGQSVLLEACEFRKNTSSESALVTLDHPETLLTIRSCDFTDNSVYLSCLHVQSGSAELKSCLFSGNTGDLCGALSVSEEGTCSLSDYTVIHDNQADGEEALTGGVFSLGSFQMDRSAVHGNRVSLSSQGAPDLNLMGSVDLPPAREMMDQPQGGTVFTGYVFYDHASGALYEDGNRVRESGCYEARQILYLAENGGNRYLSLGEALRSAGAGDTVRMISMQYGGPKVLSLSNLTLSGKRMILDLNDHTLRSRGKILQIPHTSQITLRNGTLEGTVENSGYLRLERVRKAAIEHLGGSLVFAGKSGDVHVTLQEGQSLSVEKGGSFSDLHLTLGEGDALSWNDLWTRKSPWLVVLSDNPDLTVTLSGISSPFVTFEYDPSLGGFCMKKQLPTGVWLDGTAGDDEKDGTHAAPVRTFARARQLLAEAVRKGLSPAGIFISGTVTVSGEEVWSLQEAGPSLKIFRDPLFRGLPVRVTGRLRLENITMDGNREAGQTSASPFLECSGSLELGKGARILNNRNEDGPGGIASRGGKIFLEEGALLQGNTGIFGGGIALYDQALLVMEGGTLAGNTASAGGGGLFIDRTSSAEITGGQISENSALGEDGRSGGGGILVEGEDSLRGSCRMARALIRDNTASTGGGLYASSGSGTWLYASSGSAIFGNRLLNDGEGRDLALIPGKNEAEQMTAFVSMNMLGGGEAAWRWDGDGPVSSGTVMKNTELAEYGSLLLRSHAATGSRQKAEKAASVRVTGNHALREGGGISSHGHVLMGKKTDLTVRKVWEDQDNLNLLRPDAVEVFLRACVLLEDVWVEIPLKDLDPSIPGSLVLNEANDWTGTWLDLPQTVLKGESAPTGYQNPEIHYSVYESNPSKDYVSRLTGNMEDGYTLTNYHLPGLASLSVIKRIDGREWNKDDTFQFRLKPLNGAPLRTVRGDMEELTVRMDALMEGHEAFFEPLLFTRSDLMGLGARSFFYTLEEVMPEEDTGFTPSDPVRVQVNLEEQNGQLMVTYGEERWDALMVPELVNTYHSRAGQSAVIRCGKTLMDGKGEALTDWQGRTFTLTLHALRDAPLPEEEEITLSGENPEAGFGPIRYESPGTYDYLITEKLPDGVDASHPADAGVLYDLSVHAVRVTVPDEGSGIPGTPVIEYRTDPEGSMVRMTNRTAPDAAAVLRIRKTLEGGVLKAGDFAFDLYASDARGNTVQWLDRTVCSADGLVVFQPLAFFHDDLFHPALRLSEAALNRYYLIRETNAPGKGYARRGEDLLIRVSIAHDPDHTLRVLSVAWKEGEEWKETGSEIPEIRNIYEAHGLERFSVSKRLAGTQWGEEDRFEIRVYPVNGAPLNGNKYLRAVADSTHTTVWFDPVIYNQEDLYDQEQDRYESRRIFSYLIHEYIGDEQGRDLNVTEEPFRNDRFQYARDLLLDVAVEDAGEGTLKVTVLPGENGLVRRYLTNQAADHPEVLSLPQPSAPPRDDKNRVYFSFTKEWVGEPGNPELDLLVYTPKGNAHPHRFNRTRQADGTWTYEAWFAEEKDYFVVEVPEQGYVVTYVNLPPYADVTDRCYDGGRIINRRIPATGDPDGLYLILGGSALILLCLLPALRRRGGGRKNRARF